MNTCVCCGAPIPEGRQVCPTCERAASIKPDVILKDGTHLYLKTGVGPKDVPLQLFIYNLLNHNK